MIHETAIISPSAVISEGCTVGAYSIINDNVILGAGTVVGTHCELGVPSALASDPYLRIGEGSLIRSHSVFYMGSSFGERLITGHRVTVRENTVAGINFQIGTLTDIQGHCTIGDYVRFHSNVHIGQKSKIGNFVWIFPYVVLTNDPHPPSEVLLGVEVEDFVAIATMSVILPGVRIGTGALIGAHSSVSKNVDPDTVVVGNPAKYICPTSKIKHKINSDLSAYPWKKHFHRGYPESVVESWIAESK
jgi:acetyltransferase-like isoleucine patch superfamily enzyme